VVASETTAEVGVERRGHVAVVSLRRAQALNSVTQAMAERLRDVLLELGRDDSVWVVVLTAEGDRAFCAGADLSERHAMSPEQLSARRAALRAMFAAVREVPQPTVAAVFGYTVGGGLELALSCDLVVAADDAQLGLPEARVGLVPAGGGTFLLARALGPARAKELMFTGRRLDAQAALGFGLVADVVPRTDLVRAAMRLAERIAESSPVSTRLVKRAIRDAQRVDETAALEAEETALGEATASRDAAEGLRAFTEKRPPRWENR
jgi:enoyl-CoA hydratase/carnithine racemase